MRFPSFRFLAAVTIALTAVDASAGEIYEFYNGVRSLGMGGAYTAIVNDETALWHQPAGLGKLRDAFFTLADPEVDVTSGLTLQDIGSIASAQGMLDILKEKPGKHFHSGAQISPSIVIPNFGVGVLGKYRFDAEVDTTGTTYSMEYNYDVALALGYNFRLWNGIVKLGFNAKLINRVEVDEDVPVASTGLTFEDYAAEGMGIGSDVGLIITLPIRFLPSLSAVVRDVGHTSFTMTDGMFYQTGERRPEKAKQKLDAGFALFPIVSNRVRATLTAEVHDLMTDDELEKTDLMRRFHGGLEINMADFFFLRGGYNQKFWTAGFEFASERFQLQGAAYGEDIGTPNAPREDRRFVGKFALRF